MLRSSQNPSPSHRYPSTGVYPPASVGVFFLSWVSSRHHLWHSQRDVQSLFKLQTPLASLQESAKTPPRLTDDLRIWCFLANSGLSFSVQEAVKGDILKWDFAEKFALDTSILTALFEEIPQGKHRLDRQGRRLDREGRRLDGTVR